MSDTNNTSLIEVPKDEQATLVRKDMLAAMSEEIEALKKLGDLKITDVNDKQQVDLVKSANARVRDARIAIENRRKDLKQPYLEIGRNIDSIAKSLTAEIQPAEDALSEQVAWQKEESDRIRQALIDSRVRLLEDAGFETAQAEDATAWVAGDVAILETSLYRLGDKSFDRMVRKGVKALAAIKAERERQRLAEEEAKRAEERAAAIKAEEEAKAEHEPESLVGRTLEPGEVVDIPVPKRELPGQGLIIRSSLGEAMSVANSDAPEAIPTTRDDVAAMEEAMTALYAAWKPGFMLYVMDGKLCFVERQGENGTIPVPSFEVEVPIFCIDKKQEA